MTGTGMTYANTGQFVSYYPSETATDVSSGNQFQVRNPRADASTGTVDMAGYLKWLRDNGYELGNLQAR